jgi:hypothetical protein
MADPNIPAILAEFSRLCLAHGGDRRSLAAADVLRESRCARLEVLLGLAGWPDACTSPRRLGIALATVARSTPWVDGRVLVRASTGRWSVVSGPRL